jgi:Mrp family chromosome partitioning ATPase/uncharacterized protein involved in exopolysaccharide biosynthesis
MDLLYFIKALYKKWWVITLSVIIAMAAAFLFTRQEKKIYKSTAQIATGFTMNDLVSLNNQTTDIYSSELKFSNVIETINSPQVLNLLSCSLILHDLNSPKDAFRHILPNDLERDGISASDLQKGKGIFTKKLKNMKMLSSFSPEEKKLLKLLDVYGYDQQTLSKEINVYRLNRTDFVNIDSYTDNPMLSAFIVNTLCREFNRFYASFLSQRSEGNVQILDTLKDKKLQILEERQAALKTAMQGGNADVAQTSANLIAQYQAQIVNKRSDLTVAQLSLNAVNKQLADLDTRQQNMNGTNNDIIQLNNQINTLTSQYINDGSKDQVLASRISALKLKLQQKYSEASLPMGQMPTKADLLQKKTNFQVQVQSAQADIADLQKTISSLSGSVRSNAGRDIMIQALQKDVERATADYNNVNEKYGMAMNDISQSGNFRQILFGQPSLTPESSKRLIIIALSGVSAAALTVLVIVLLLYFDVSIKAPSAFQKQTGITILSSTNWINLKKENVINIVNTSSNSDKNHKRNRRNIFREHVRKIRQSLDNSPKQVILFTSTEHGHGKTTIIQALAYSMSLSRKKVLLIDTNFCNNDLTTQTQAKATLEKFSVTGSLKDMDLEELVTHSDIPGVDIVGCEGGDYKPQEIVYAGNLLEHMDDLKKRYDYILLESAPMNSYTDTRELIKYVDGVVSVFSAEAVIKPADTDAIEYLKNLNGKFQGAILNKVGLDNMQA